MKLSAYLHSTVATVALGVLPTIVLAQMPPSYANAEEHIDGTVASVEGPYKIHVHDDRGYADDVTLHEGTVINPTGLKLSAGQRIHVTGRADGGTFDANEIDTPYSIEPPTDEYAYGVDAYPYPYYGYSYDYYPYSPFFGGLGFGFFFDRGFDRGGFGHGGLDRGFGRGGFSRGGGGFRSGGGGRR